MQVIENFEEGMYYVAEKTNEKPRAVRSHDVEIDKEYIQWIQDIKQRFRNSQIKAAVLTCRLNFRVQRGSQLETCGL